MTKKGLLERLAEGPVLGDGGFVFAMEKRGYVKAGPWTPEVVMEHPEAGNYNQSIMSLRIERLKVVPVRVQSILLLCQIKDPLVFGSVRS